MTDEAAWAWGDVSSEVAPRSAAVPIVLNGQIAAELEAARSALRTAQRESDDLEGGAITEARAEVTRLEDAARASTRTFTVHSLGYREWRELCEAHPAKVAADRWDSSTFVPAVLLACCDQFTNAAQVADAVERLSTGQIAALFGRARELNEGDDRVPL